MWEDVFCLCAVEMSRQTCAVLAVTALCEICVWVWWLQSRPVCLVFSGACSHVWSGNCSVLCKVWVLGVFYHCDKVWKGLVTACFMHFLLHKTCQWVGLQLWERNKGLCFRRSRKYTKEESSWVLGITELRVQFWQGTTYNAETS